MIPVRANARPAVRARPATAGHQDALDGVRAAAAAAVLITHVGGMTGFVLTGTPASWVVSRGNVGVPVFFVLSGLLLYRPWAAAALAGTPGSPLGGYLLRRALRILPAYWAVVAIALPVLSPGPARHAGPWVQYLLLTQNYDSRPWWTGTGAPGLAQDWSLAVEVSFYLVLPLLGSALTWFACRGGTAGPASLSRRARRLLAGLAVLGLSSPGWAVLAYYPRPEPWFSATLPPMMIWFAAGMALAVVSAWAAAEPPPGGPAAQFCRAVSSSAGMCALIAVAAFAIACTPVAGPEFISVLSLWSTEIRLLLFTVVALALVAPVALAAPVARAARAAQTAGPGRPGPPGEHPGRAVGRRNADAPRAEQPGAALPRPDLLRHLSLAAAHRHVPLLRGAPQAAVRGRLLHHTTGRGHLRGHRRAHRRRRHRELLPDRTTGPQAGRADAVAGPEPRTGGGPEPRASLRAPAGSTPRPAARG